MVWGHISTSPIAQIPCSLFNVHMVKRTNTFRTGVWKLIVVIFGTLGKFGKSDVESRLIIHPVGLSQKSVCIVKYGKWLEPHHQPSTPRKPCRRLWNFPLLIISSRLAVSNLTLVVNAVIKHRCTCLQAAKDPLLPRTSKDLLYSDIADEETIEWFLWYFMQIPHVGHVNE